MVILQLRISFLCVWSSLWCDGEMQVQHHAYPGVIARRAEQGQPGREWGETDNIQTKGIPEVCVCVRVCVCVCVCVWNPLQFITSH